MPINLEWVEAIEQRQTGDLTLKQIGVLCRFAPHSRRRKLKPTNEKETKRFHWTAQRSHWVWIAKQKEQIEVSPRILCLKLL